MNGAAQAATQGGSAAEAAPPDVLRLDALAVPEVADLLARFGLCLVVLDPATTIPGSYWGEDEAGLIGAELYARPDTPLHSILHEACHWIVMDPALRPQVHTDASDSLAEEDATCYLQILLAGHVPGFDSARALADMDAWGYSFRLGSARAWFERDAEDARAWLQAHQLIDADGNISFQVRQRDEPR